MYEGDRKVLRPAKTCHGKENERDTHAFPLWRDEREERAEDDHHGYGGGESPFPVADLAAEDGEEGGAETETC